MTYLHYQDLGYGITLVDNNPFHPSMYANYIIQSNGLAALVDVGTGQSVQIQLDVLKALDIPLDAVRYICLTHLHLDHAGATGGLLPHLPNAQVVCHPNAARHLIDPERLIASVKMVYGEEEYNLHQGPVLPVPKERIIEAKDGFILHLGKRPLLFRDTPGHAKHHICIVDVEGRGIFTGDAVGVSYRFMDVNGRQFLYPATTPNQLDPVAYHASVDMLVSYKLAFMYLTHFGRVSDPENAIKNLHRCLDDLTNMAQSIASESNRYSLLLAKIKRYIFAELQQHGCTLCEAEMEQRLTVDNDLNAQGLLNWLEQQNKPRVTTK